MYNQTCEVKLCHDFSFVCSSPLSSMVFGTNALFTKPAQSLAPMIVLSILNQFGYEQLKDARRDADPRCRHFVFVLKTLIKLLALVSSSGKDRFSILIFHILAITVLFNFIVYNKLNHVFLLLLVKNIK